MPSASCSRNPSSVEFGNTRWPGCRSKRCRGTALRTLALETNNRVGPAKGVQAKPERLGLRPRFCLDARIGRAGSEHVCAEVDVRLPPCSATARLLEGYRVPEGALDPCAARHPPERHPAVSALEAVRGYTGPIVTEA